MIVGETPGPEEDLEAEPFVGRRRKLVDDCLTQAGIDPLSVWKTTMVKCCPPKGKSPTAENVRECKVWLWRELREFKPLVVVTFGLTSTRLLLRSTSLKLKSVLGEHRPVLYDGMAVTIVPWHGMHKLLQSGREMHTQTINLFRGIAHVLA